MRMGNKLGERGDKARNGRRQKQVWQERPRGCPCGHAGSYCGNWQCGEASSRCVAQGGGMKTTSRLQVSGKAPLGGIGLRHSAKRDRKSITLHMKLEVLRRFEEGEKLTQIARALGLATSTVASIRVNKDKIRANSQAATPVSATQLTRCRGVVMGHMERLLSLWIEEQKRQNLPISTLLIQDKARRLFVQLQHEQGSGTQAETFGASNGWFARFKARNNVLLTDEPAVADTQAAAHYPPVLRTILEEGCYSPHQVFNVDETGLFWKRLPERMLLALEGAAGPGLKASKDHLTLLLGGNAAGDFKLKPLLVYPSENPRALKGCSKASLPVVWRSNRNDWLTPSIFQEWFTGCFCPAVESYCASHGLPHRALLLLDGAPCHPAHLGGLSAHVRVEFLPKNTSALIQPMNQGVIATFKAYYLRRTLSQLVQETTGEDRPSVQEFWRSYTVVTAVDNIAEAWAELQPATMNSAWRKLWPECVPAGTPEPDTVPQLRRSIVALARHVGLGDAAEADVASLLQAHGEPPPHSIPQDAKDGAMSGSGLPWETGNGLVSRKQEPDFTEAVVLIENDPNRERSLRVSRGVHCALARLRELHRERRRQSRAAASSGGPVVVAARELAGSLPLPQFVFLSPQTVITGIMGCPPDCRNTTWASKPQSVSKGRCSCALAG
ncbi:tigger transposable element-derived protein 1-like isoform X4 [Panthera leo]|uniref:tigger transposable element-derived protein 1-like isoform X4 n=1 Tax=Panthera leo TaxID=9689 RepID=UPI001C6A65DB|nr:tigger transposable element-derived protein 1-like isoform X4 [Panthera leo]